MPIQRANSEVLQSGLKVTLAVKNTPGASKLPAVMGICWWWPCHPGGHCYATPAWKEDTASGNILSGAQKGKNCAMWESLCVALNFEILVGWYFRGQQLAFHKTCSLRLAMWERRRWKPLSVKQVYQVDNTKPRINLLMKQTDCLLIGLLSKSP